MAKRSSKRPDGEPQLVSISLPWDPEREVPPDMLAFLGRADALLQKYWDSWYRRPIEQYVACDFRDVWRALEAVETNRLAPGKLFCEWGCGFGVVTAMASMLGWDAIGIEAEEFLSTKLGNGCAVKASMQRFGTGIFFHREVSDWPNDKPTTRHYSTKSPTPMQTMTWESTTLRLSLRTRGQARTTSSRMCLETTQQTNRCCFYFWVRMRLSCIGRRTWSIRIAMFSHSRMVSRL